MTHELSSVSRRLSFFRRMCSNTQSIAMMEETDFFSEEVVCMWRFIGTLIGAGLILYGIGTLLSHTLFGDPRDEQRALAAAEQYVATTFPELDLSAVHASLKMQRRNMRVNGCVTSNACSTRPTCRSGHFSSRFKTGTSHSIPDASTRKTSIRKVWLNDCNEIIKNGWRWNDRRVD